MVTQIARGNRDWGMHTPPRRRRHLPHGETGLGADFLTWRLHAAQIGLTAEERDLVLDVVLRTPPDWCVLSAVVIMDDHVHVLIRASGTRTPAQLAQAWKSISAHELVRAGCRTAPVWQAEYFDRHISGARQMERCVEYIRCNPTRRWPNVIDYRWVVVLPPPP